MVQLLETYTGTLLVAQALMHIGITLRIASWSETGRNYRPGVSMLAFALAGSSAASAGNIIMRWEFVSAQTVQPFMTIFVAIVLALVLKSRGNVAHLLRS